MDGSGFILTKIIATLGPASSEPQVIARLISEGVRVFRINFSHGSADDYARLLLAVRQASEDTAIPVAVLGDLPGPKIRLGRLAAQGIELEPGMRVCFERHDDDADQPPSPTGFAVSDDGDEITVPSTYPALVDDVQVGQRVFIDDGNVRMLVVDRQQQGDTRRLICQVLVGGRVTSGKGVNLPDSHLSIAAFTARDRECAQWAIDNGIDFLAMSFVRKAQDLQPLRTLLADRTGPMGASIPVIAKIEKPQALADLDAIVRDADGIMVARGDLGVEMDLAQVPLIQKRIIKLAHDYGKPVIVATQMLQSMIDNATPTRAEVSDVANAIYDGADAVMLSGETAVGKYPIPTVHMMARTALTTEHHIASDPHYRSRAPMKLRESRYRTAALAHGVSVVVGDLKARLVVTWSELGGTARYLSQNRLGVPILACSSNKPALRQMNLMFGVNPHYMPRPAGHDQFIHDVDRIIQQRKWAQVGDPIVIVKGEPLGTPGVTNELLIHYVGDTTRLRWRVKPSAPSA